MPEEQSSHQSISYNHVTIRDSVISPKVNPTPADNQRLPQSSPNTTPVKYDRDTKEIDQKESPKLLVLIDTRLTTGLADKEDQGDVGVGTEDITQQTHKKPDAAVAPSFSKTTDDTISPIQAVGDTGAGTQSVLDCSPWLKP